MAEYREIARVYELARQAYPRRAEIKIPPAFVLGTGHVTFFYDKLGFVLARHALLIEEMQRRGYGPQYLPPCPTSLPYDWLNGYAPTSEALRLSRERIANRTNPSWLSSSPSSDLTPG